MMNQGGKRKFEEAMASRETQESSAVKSKKMTKSSGGFHWSLGLKASMEDPKLKVDSDEKTVTIKDKYPKAKYHFLIMSKDEIPGLKSLNSRHISLLEHMHRRAQELTERIKKEDENVEFRIGYHSVPSMRHLHLHVISQDFDSPCLKNKKHWNSFTSDFFQDSQKILEILTSTGKVQLDESKYEKILKSPLRCHRCKQSQTNMPKLKSHIAMCRRKQS